MGSTGRVSRLLLSHWRHRCSSSSPEVYTQSRKAGFDLMWSPIEDGPEPLQKFIHASGPLTAIVAMIGSTPSTSGNMSDTATLVQAVVRAAEYAGVPRVLIASSSAVYALGEDLSEDDLIVPTSAYGRAKLEMEQAVLNMETNVEVCCLRIGNVAGADALLGGSNQISMDDPIKLDQFPDGKGPLRSYIGPSQLAACLKQLAGADGPIPSILNCASEPPVEMTELVDAAQLPWEWSPAPKERYGAQRITLDCSRLRETIGSCFLEATPAGMVADLRKLGVVE